MSFLWCLFIARGIIEIIIDRSKKSVFFKFPFIIYRESVMLYSIIVFFQYLNHFIANGSILDSLFPSVSGIKGKRNRLVLIV